MYINAPESQNSNIIAKTCLDDLRMNCNSQYYKFLHSFEIWSHYVKYNLAVLNSQTYLLSERLQPLVQRPLFCTPKLRVIFVSGANTSSAGLSGVGDRILFKELRCLCCCICFWSCSSRFPSGMAMLSSASSCAVRNLLDGL